MRNDESVMLEPYNPVVRTFCRLRAALLQTAGVPREAIRPDTLLEELLPEATRRVVWREMQRSGLALPNLQLSKHDARSSLPGALKVAAGFAISLRSWSALLLALPLAAAAHRLSRRRAIQFPLGLRTIGELAICLTHFPDHRASGYRWTPNEIALKVRMIVAESVGRPLADVRLDSKIIDLAR